MKRIRILMTTILCAASLTGCAGYSITHNGDGDGYDVYRPEPYLFITETEKGHHAEIVWLPNFSERYRIDTWNFFAKSDIQFEIDGGWKLTKISDKSDNTAIASKLMGIVDKATRAGTIALTGQDQLYRLVYNEKGEFIGMKYVPVMESDD